MIAITSLFGLLGLLPTALPNGDTAFFDAITYGAEMEYRFQGEAIDKYVSQGGAAGTLEYQRSATVKGAQYSAQGTAGLNWAGLSCDVFGYRNLEESATVFRAEMSRVTRDRCKLRAQGYSGQPLNLYLVIIVEGTQRATSQVGSDCWASYEAWTSGENGALGGSIIHGAMHSQGGVDEYIALPPGTYSVGPITCTENVPFDLVHAFSVSTTVSAWSTLLGAIGSAECNFGRTFRVGGVEVRNLADAPVTNFTLLSQLGIDWTKKANPAKLKSLTTNLTTAVGGTTLVGTVTLNQRAEQGGQTVLLRSKNLALATVPESVTLAYRATAGDFSIQTSPVGTQQTVDIVAHMGAVSKTKTLTLTPAAPL